MDKTIRPNVSVIQSSTVHCNCTCIIIHCHCTCTHIFMYMCHIQEQYSEVWLCVPVAYAPINVNPLLQGGGDMGGDLPCCNATPHGPGQLLPLYRGRAHDVTIDIRNRFCHLGRQMRAMADKCNERETGRQPLCILPTCLFYLETILRFF